MRRHLIAAAVLGMAATTSAHAEFKTSGDVIVGWGNAGIDNGFYGLGILKGTYSTRFENGFDFSFALMANLRSWQDDIRWIEDNYVDFDLNLDMQQYGKIRWTSARDIRNRPYADGDLFNGGGVPIFTALPNAYRGVSGNKVFFGKDGKRYKSMPESILTYDNTIGNLTIESNINPTWSYAHFDRDQLAEDAPWGDIQLEYDAKFISGEFKANSIGDLSFGLKAPVGRTGWAVRAQHEVRDGDFGDTRTEAGFTYRANPKSTSLFRGMIFIYTYKEGEELTLAGATFGRRDWEVQVATDSDGDWAVEASRKINKQLSIHAAMDSGFDYYEGFDDRLIPPVSSPERGRGYEIALRYQF